MECAEDVQFDDTDTMTQFMDTAKHRAFMSPQISTVDTDFHIYAQIIKEYSSRGLTHQSDILYALEGVLTVMRNTFPPSAFTFNMPLALLDVALLWHPVAPLRRRKLGADGNRIPSWSWAGWIGPVHYFEATMNAAERLQTPDWPGFSQRNQVQSGTAHDVVWKRVIEDYGAAYVLSSTKVSSMQHFRYARPIYHNPWHVTRAFLRSRTLHFNGQVGSFTITLEHLKNVSIPNASRCTGNTHIACYLGVHDANGKQCGYIVVDGNTFRTLRAGSYDFVRLSQMTLSHTEDDPTWDDDTQAFSREPGKPGDASKYEWFTASGKPERELYFDNTVYDPTIAWCLYNVMMVDWKDGVGYRLGIGSMHVTAWENSSPTTQEVVLG